MGLSQCGGVRSIYCRLALHIVPVLAGEVRHSRTTNTVYSTQKAALGVKSTRYSREDTVSRDLHCLVLSCLVWAAAATVISPKLLWCCRGVGGVAPPFRIQIYHIASFSRALNSHIFCHRRLHTSGWLIYRPAMPTSRSKIYRGQLQQIHS